MTGAPVRRLELQAKAKVNLALHVTGRRADGYHLLDSLVVFADTGDKLELANADKTSLDIIGPFGKNLTVDDDNMVFQAYRALSRALGIVLPATAFKLTKNLPVSSGIGGGSADAAAALRGLIELWQLDVEPKVLHDIALALGADVPVCLASVSCQMAGVGETLSDIKNFPTIDCVLVNSGAAVSTPEVFGKLALLTGERGLSAMPDLPDAHWISWLESTRNDLQNAAIEIAPEIAGTIVALEKFPACQLARMSGSGATCFGLFANAQEAQEAARQLTDDHPDWWVVATFLG